MFLISHRDMHTHCQKKVQKGFHLSELTDNLKQKYMIKVASNLNQLLQVPCQSLLQDPCCRYQSQYRD